MQTYEIRRNCDGNMLYFDAKELVDLCLDNHILYGVKNKWVAMYHEASETQPELYPEGYYNDDYEDVIQTLMRDDTAVKLLLDELSKENIIFTPSLDINLLDQSLIKKEVDVMENKELSVVIITYNFSDEINAVVFDNYNDACEFIQNDFAKEKEIDIKENGYQIDEENTYCNEDEAVLSTIYTTGTGTTKWQIANVIDKRNN